MRVPLAWLEEWIDLPGSPSQVAERLTLGGLEVEEIEGGGPDLSAFRVGRVVARDPHPGADRLSLCRVDLGEGAPVQIVCGAPNVAAGQRVAVAPPGTRMPDGKRLKKVKIRGVESHGMICSEAELGVGEDQRGILVLDPSAPVGAPLDRVLLVASPVMEVAIPPNRGDTASLLGVAREVRAHFGGEVRIPPWEPTEEDRRTAEDASVEIEDPEGCHLYVARVVRGLRSGPTPEGIRRKLEAAGIRSIHLVVDITNLVLLEFGQPIHAFDLATIPGGQVRVRRGRTGERLRTLDGQIRTLSPEDLVIADATRPIALAGVMGGADTEVRDTTTDVLIESAHFRPSSVRRTARRLGLQTEASYRFERGVDHDGVARAADRAARLMAELGGGRVSREPIEVRGSAPPVTEEIRVDPGRINRLLGTDLSREEIVGLLERVGVTCLDAGDGALGCRVPSHRNDLARMQDLAEEVARTFGCDRIRPTLPVAELRAPELPRAHRAAEQARNSLRSAGLLETMSLPFVSGGDLDRLLLGPDDPRRAMVGVLNPIVEERRFLRPLLLPSLLQATQRNLARQVEEVRLFEVASIYRPGAAGALPDEPPHVGAVLVRGQGAHLWQSPERPAIFYEAKGVVELLTGDLGCAVSFVAPSQEPFLHPGAACGLACGDRPIGWVGELHPDVASAFEIGASCAVLEIDLGVLLAVPVQEPRYRELSRHPRARRDLAVVVGREHAAGELLETIRKTAGSMLIDAELFDRYAGRGVPDGKVSLAFRLVFQRPDRALTDEEVAKQMERIVHALARRFGAALR